MTTSHSIHRSLSGITNSAKRLMSRTSSKANNHPFGSDFARDRDFARVVQDLEAMDRASWRR